MKVELFDPSCLDCVFYLQATFKIEEVPNERPKSPILNHNILAGRTSSKSTILDEVPMLEGSLRKEEVRSPGSSCLPSNRPIEVLVRFLHGPMMQIPGHCFF